jgi:hypothetical protein
VALQVAADLVRGEAGTAAEHGMGRCAVVALVGTGHREGDLLALGGRQGAGGQGPGQGEKPAERGR